MQRAIINVSINKERKKKGKHLHLDSHGSQHSSVHKYNFTIKKKEAKRNLTPFIKQPQLLLKEIKSDSRKYIPAAQNHI